MNEEIFVEYLKKNFGFKGFKGIGDDCSIVKVENHFQLISKDLLIENVHFNLDYYDFVEVGKKSISVNISDILASGGIAEYFYLGLGFPFKRFSDNHLIEFLEGIKEFSELYNIELAGGDLTNSEILVVSITIVGKSLNPILRSNAKKGDLICISDYVGESSLGLKLLQRGIKNNYYTQKHKIPILNIEKSLKIAELSNSMIDVSDGLLKDLNRILTLSHKGGEIYIEKIPYKKDFYKFCEKYNLDYKELMLAGGEDYSLLFTISNENFKRIKTQGIEIYDIGIITNESGLRLFDKNKEVDFKTKGFDHFEL